MNDKKIIEEIAFIGAIGIATLLKMVEKGLITEAEMNEIINNSKESIQMIKKGDV